jgi:hypothetical protein
LSSAKCPFIVFRMAPKLERRSVIQYSPFRGKTNQKILLKSQKGYLENGLRIRAGQKWTARYCGGQVTVEDETRPKMLHRTDLGDGILRFLEKLHLSSREIRNSRPLPETTALPVLHGRGDLMACRSDRRPINSNLLETCLMPLPASDPGNENS